MKPEEWWKNFSLGLELDVAGSFIYNGLKTLHELEVLDHTADVFEVLYNLAVGLERLFKVAIVLAEHDETIDEVEFEEGMITHNTMELANRVGRHLNLNLARPHKEFLSSLAVFYKSHRYGRYILRSVPNIESEKKALHGLLEKHLQVEVGDAWLGPELRNSDRIRRFVGKLMKTIVSPTFEFVLERATELNIYTYELRSDSKAMRVFWGRRLDFIDEDRAKRELILYLMHPGTNGDHVATLRSFDPLDLDPSLAPEYIKALLNDVHLGSVMGELEEVYTEVEDVGTRFEMLELLDKDYLADPLPEGEDDPE